ncbi:MAG: ATP-grasp domain-containing protein, partial [Candidatus Contubernalis sp.]|nr:ATP-grasp domain-containing protein [Candidatus Contubernalis sp.]
MKIAIIYNRDSQAVINLFGVPSREKYGLETINNIRDALVKGGHQVKTFEGDKNIIYHLEEFMPSVISGERPGLVFNLSYGIQGRGRYMHIPGILEMLGVPYVGSGPETHAIALDKVITKMILIQRGLPTPRFAVLEKPDSPLAEDLNYPLIVKPKDEAVSFGLKIVNDEEELREGARVIYEMFKSPTLVEEYIQGREINIGLLGNDPVEALPPVELFFGEGEQIYTYEDKIKKSGREIQKVCPAELSLEQTEQLKSLAIASFKALGCFDSARVDFRIDNEGNPYILEVNSMASLGPGGSYVFAANKVGLDYEALANKLIEIASKRYFGSSLPQEMGNKLNEKGMSIFNFLTQNRDHLEDELHSWTSLPSWTDDPVGISAAVRRFDERLSRLGLTMVEQFTNRRSAWTLQTDIDIKRSTLLVLPIDVPRDGGKYPVLFRRDPEWLYGEGIASSRAPMVCLLQALEALHSINKLLSARLSVFLYSDEGRGLRYSSSLLQQVAKTVKQVIILQPGYRG